MAALLISRSVIAAHAADAAHLIDLKDNAGIVAAVATGDRAKLETVAGHSTSPFEQQFAQAAMYRVDFDLAAADGAFSSCEKALTDPDNPNRTLCSLMLLGDAFIERRMDQWLEKLRSIHDTYDPVIEKHYPGRGLQLRGAEGVSVISDVPFGESDVIMARPGFDIPYVSDRDRQGIEKRIEPLVQVTIGGQTIHALIDTGSSYDIISPALANRLKIRPSLRYDKLTDGNNQTVSATMGTAPTIVMGEATIRRWPVTVAESPFPIIIGLPLLSKMGGVVMTGKKITIGGSLVAPACQQPMRFASNLDGSVTKLITRITVDGKSNDATVDTGGAFTVLNGVDTKTMSDSDSTERVVFAGGISEKRIGKRHGLISFGGPEKPMDYIVMSDAFHLTPYQVGSGVLGDLSLVMDFTHRRLCVQ
nr:retropepsin-like aspartic protease [Dyella sp. ASV24]